GRTGNGGGCGRTVIAAEAAGARTGHGANGGAADFADARVAALAGVDIAGAVGSDVFGPVELRGQRHSAAIGPAHFAGSSDGMDDAVGGDFADDIAVPVGRIDVARAVDGDAAVSGDEGGRGGHFVALGGAAAGDARQEAGGVHLENAIAALAVGNIEVAHRVHGQAGGAHQRCQDRRAAFPLVARLADARYGGDDGGGRHAAGAG